MPITALHLPEDADGPLAAMGLTPEVFDRAGTEALLAFLNTSSLDPASFPGTAFWAAATRSLRQQLLPDNWTRSDLGLALVTHPEGRFSIVVSSGTTGTGKPGEHASTRYPRGEQVQARIEVNRIEQLGLFGNVVVKTETVSVPVDRLWLFLHYRDAVRKELRMELSLPVELDKTGRVETWRTRIMIPPIAFSDLEGKGLDLTGLNDAADDEDDFPDISMKI